jgi:hypothetical protein
MAPAKLKKIPAKASGALDLRVFRSEPGTFFAVPV